jgi:hypothetical protein
LKALAAAAANSSQAPGELAMLGDPASRVVSRIDRELRRWQNGHLPLIFDFLTRRNQVRIILDRHGIGLNTQGIVERLLRVVDVLVMARGDDPRMFVGKCLLAV